MADDSTKSHRLFRALNAEELIEAERLLVEGANPNTVLPVEGVASMHIASGLGEGATKLLLKYGGDPNIRSADGTTPLHVAATWGDQDCLRLLLFNGGNPFSRDQDDCSVLDAAKSFGHISCLQLLECYSLLLCPEVDSFKAPKVTRQSQGEFQDLEYTDCISERLSNCMTAGDGQFCCDVTSPDHPYIEYKNQTRESDFSEDTNDLAFCHDQNSCHVHWADELTKTLPWTGSLNDSRTSTSTDDDTFLSCSSGLSPKQMEPTQKQTDGQSSSFMFNSQNVHGPTRLESSSFQSKTKLELLCDDQTSDPGWLDGRSCGQSLDTFVPSVSSVKQTQICGHFIDHTILAPKQSSSFHGRKHSESPVHLCDRSRETLRRPDVVSDQYDNPASRRDDNTCGNCNKLRGDRTEKPHTRSPLQVIDRKKVRSERKVQNWLNKSAGPQKLVDGVSKISLSESKPYSLWKPPLTNFGLDNSDLISNDESFYQRQSQQKSASVTLHNMPLLSENIEDSVVEDSSDTLLYDRKESCVHPSVSAGNSRSSLPTEHVENIIENDDTLLYDYEQNSLTDTDILNQSFSRLSVDSGATVEYIYTDPEEGVVLVERRIPSQCGSTASTQRLSLDSGSTTLTADSQATQIYDWKSLCKSTRESDVLEETDSRKSTEIPSCLRSLSNDEIRGKLTKLGDDPGPVTPATRQTYLVRLQLVENDPQLALGTKLPGYSSEMNSALQGQFTCSVASDLECKMVAAFQNPCQNRRWREGTIKSSFNYLLLDPRVTRNLPNRSASLSEVDTLRAFVSAIFYVGKGKRARPYCHLYEAINQVKSPKQKVSNKVQHILEIWGEGQGVVSLHCFQSVIPVEAYTREACLVDALGISNLTNKKRGDYYGVATTWSAKQRRQVGVYLLKKALQIFLGEGERQISPADIKVGQ